MLSRASLIPPGNDALPSLVECALLPLPLPSREELTMLREAGATEYALRDVRAFPAVFRRGCFFDLAKHPGDGERAILVPIRDVLEQVVDVGAWRPHDPRTIALMTGAAALLGEGMVGNPATFARGRALNVFRTATAWLAHDCRGVVIADEARAGMRLADAPRLLCEDPAHGRELRDLLSPSVPAERIFVARPLSGAA